MKIELIKNRLRVGWFSFGKWTKGNCSWYTWFYSLENKATKENDHVLQLCIFGLNIAWKHRIEKTKGNENI